MSKKLVRYKNVNGVLVKQFESPALVNGTIDISQLPVVGTMGAAIIETGENANGRYTKFADGTMICTSVINLTGLDVAPDHAIWSTYQYTSPAAFVGARTFDIKPNVATDSTTTGLLNMPYVGFVGAHAQITMYNTGNTAQSVNPGVAVRGGGTIRIKAINFTVTVTGRWK
ncbi:hypothetical protein [Cloacibacillus porcorum]|uniref:hypothetical protein n=1 Tax=Cloacibacillus porcorum TaxID=1197717 RepID=UPI0026724DCF|nr:hypothetical protein [Cloacibacillus porcorum]